MERTAQRSYGSSLVLPRLLASSQLQMPRRGFEPLLPFGEADFESTASANSSHRGVSDILYVAVHSLFKDLDSYLAALTSFLIGFSIYTAKR
jgi:hypothetical protein